MPDLPGHRPRFPIAAMMAAIALLAFEMAAFRVASDGYVDLTRHLTVAILVVATFRARYASGDRAAWWFGFAVFGWAYLVLAIDASSRRHVGSATSVSPLPPITLLGLFLSDQSSTSSSGLWVKVWWNQFEILQSMIALILASLGGLATWIWARRRGAPYRLEALRSGKLELGDPAA